MLTTGQRVRALRKAHDWTQDELLARTARYMPDGQPIVRESLSRIENDHSPGDLASLAALASALGTSADYLACRTENPAPQGKRSPLPVPDPDMAVLVPKLNQLAPRYRQAVIEALITLLDAYNQLDENARGAQAAAESSTDAEPNPTNAGMSAGEKLSRLRAVRSTLPPDEDRRADDIINGEFDFMRDQ